MNRQEAAWIEKLATARSAFEWDDVNLERDAWQDAVSAAEDLIEELNRLLSVGVGLVKAADDAAERERQAVSQLTAERNDARVNLARRERDLRNAGQIGERIIAALLAEPVLEADAAIGHQVSAERRGGYEYAMSRAVEVVRDVLAGGEKS